MPEQDIAVELFYDGAWHDLVANDDVFADTPIVIQRGDGDESAAPRPSLITLRLANDDDMYRTSNPESPLYGKAGVNTPIQVLVGGVSRGQAEVSSWKAGQSRGFRAFPRRGKAWVDIEAGGLQQRTGQWSKPVQSTMIKGMLSFGSTLIGVWPLEDESTSTILTQLIPGGRSGSFSGTVTLGSDDTPGGSARSVKLGSGGQLTGRFLNSVTSGWQISFAFRLTATPSSGTYEEVFSWYDSIGRRWAWQVNNINFGWIVVDPDGSTLLSNTASAFSGRDPSRWVRCRVKTTVSGSTVTYEPAWYVEGDASEGGVSWTFSGTSTGKLTTWTAQAATYNVDGAYTGVFAINDTTQNIFNPGVKADFNGHAGETAGNRFVRVLGELGLSAATNGDLDESTPMGPQPADTLPAILREIRDTDDGVLFESKAAINLVYTCRNFRYNLDPALTLNALANPSGMPSLPAEVTDDLPVHNLVTASQRNGGEVTAEDSTSRMGTLPPPDGRGEYRQTVDVNVADEVTDLPQQANWWLRRGTVDRPRFPQVVVNLAALDAAKIAEVEQATVGSVIEIINMREYTIRLHVVGYTETIGTHSRMIVFTCAPDEIFGTIAVQDTSLLDSATTTLKTAVARSDTALTFRTTDMRDVWSTTVPYDVMIAGQQCTVTAMGAASLVSGAYDQAATVVRGVNGITKDLDAGEPIGVVGYGREAY